MKRKGELEHFVGRRYSDFVQLVKQLRTELPGKILPPLPKKNKTNTTISGLFSRTAEGGDDSDLSSLSSISTLPVPPTTQGNSVTESMKNLTVRDHRRNKSGASNQPSPRTSFEGRLSPARSEVSRVTAHRLQGS